MLLEHLERIRRKSPEARRRYAFLVSFVFTGFVALIWLITLVAGINSGRFGADSQRERVPASGQPSLMDELREMFSGFDEAIRTGTQSELPDTLPEDTSTQDHVDEAEMVTESEVPVIDEGSEQETPELEVLVEADESVWEEGESLVPMPRQE